jgi:hypothetical protein
MLFQLSYFPCDMHEVAKLLARLSAPRKYSMQGSILLWEKKQQQKTVQKAAKESRACTVHVYVIINF